jgi:flavin-dependent dehydrogenase
VPYLAVTSLVSVDVVVVGARCAGAPLAALLARRGVSVVLVDQATFPRDTLSSHLFQADALAFLDRLGVIGRLRETGAPFVDRTDLRADDTRLSIELPREPGDPGGIASVRRLLLDPLLVEAAQEAGAEVRTASRVTGLLEERGRMVGVRVSNGPGKETRVGARLVVGADGRGSIVARQAGARKYNVVPNERLLYWAFFENASPGADPAFISHRWADRFILGIPSDSGLYQVLVWPEMHELDDFRSDLETAFMKHAWSCAPVAEAVDGARRVGKFFGAVRWSGYFREPSGPGWVLTGDAGHFKDPGPGRGIGDAFIQADALAPAVADGLAGSEKELDKALARWGRWRDKEFAEHYWLAGDLSKAGELPLVLPEILRGLHTRGKLDGFLDLLNHRNKPSKVLTPPRLLGATGRLVARRGSDRRRVLREVGELLGQEMRRRRLNLRPQYADDGAAAAEAEPAAVAGAAAA